MSPQTHILISGAGIAGPALALLLNKNNIRTTIIERSSALRTAGQQIDVVGAGLELIKFLGVDDAIRSRTVTDNGIKFVDANDNPFASFPASSSTASLVREIEIMRGDMAGIFYEATKAQTEYIFDDRIDSLTESDKGITVTFKNSPSRTFDLVIAADGLSSRTREIAFGKPRETVLKPLNQWVAMFMIPHAPSDGTWSRVLNAPEGRIVLLRPDVKRNQTSVYVGRGTSDMSIAGKSVTEQKEQIKASFADLGWETPRVLEHMAEADNFYVQQVAQVKMERWTKGRVALLGDAGYCPAPVSGLGTTMALLGAYVLAGNIVTYEHDLAKALQQYEEDMRPFVESAQSLGPGIPAIATPQTAWGVWVLRNVIGAVGLVMGVVQRTGIDVLLGWLFWPVSYAFKSVGWLGGFQSIPLPRYEKMKGAGGVYLGPGI